MNDIREIGLGEWCRPGEGATRGTLDRRETWTELELRGRVIGGMRISLTPKSNATFCSLLNGCNNFTV